MIIYKIASAIRWISLDEFHFLSEHRETLDVIFILYKSKETQMTY